MNYEEITQEELNELRLLRALRFGRKKPDQVSQKKHQGGFKRTRPGVKRKSIKQKRG